MRLNLQAYLIQKRWDTSTMVRRPRLTYISSLVLGPYEVSIETLWSKRKEFCKAQANEWRARYDLFKIIFTSWSKHAWIKKLHASYPETRIIFLFGMQVHNSLAKCSSEASIYWIATRIKEMDEKIENSKAKQNINKETSHILSRDKNNILIWYAGS